MTNDCNNEKLSDIVEVWFDSGSTHSFVLEKRESIYHLAISFSSPT